MDKKQRTAAAEATVGLLAVAARLKAWADTRRFEVALDRGAASEGF